MPPEDQTLIDLFVGLLRFVAPLVVGAIGLYLLLRPGRREVRAVGALLGLGLAGWLLLGLPAKLAADHRPEPFFVVFSVIAVGAAVRMITHSRPVYSALYFILVVLSSAALFLMMHAEFMAFALVIVYAGAILITYLFVLMLAQQAPDPRDPHGQPEYDVMPREPAAAVMVGLVMLSLLTWMLPQVEDGNPPPDVREARSLVWGKLEQMPQRFRQELALLETSRGETIGDPIVDREGRRVRIDADGTAYVEATVGDSSAVRRIDLPDSARPDNIQQVGLALVARFPVSLELAGVILLLAMFGAVVLARKQIELGEDEVREAAGLPRFGAEDDREGRPA